MQPPDLTRLTLAELLTLHEQARDEIRVRLAALDAEIECAYQRKEAAHA